MIVVFEGIDRAGKSSLIEKIKEVGDDDRIRSVKFPSKSGFKRAEDFFRDFSLNFPWDAGYHDSEELVLVDRFWMSTCVYQNMSSNLFNVAHEILPVDQTYVMEIDYKTWMERMDEESKEVFREIFDGNSMGDVYNTITDRYRKLCLDRPRIEIIHGSTDLEWQAKRILEDWRP